MHERALQHCLRYSELQSLSINRPQLFRRNSVTGVKLSSFFLWHGFHTLVLVIDTSRISPPACTTGLGLSRLAPNRVKLPPHTSFFFHFFGIWRNSNIPLNLTIFIQLLSTLCITTNPLQIFRFYHDSLPPS